MNASEPHAYKGKPYYESGGITIYHGDCREVMAGLAADVVLTDPPYGVGLDYGAAYSDSGDGYGAFVSDVFGAMRRVTSRVALTPGIRNLWLYPPADWVLCWSKPGTMGRSDLGGFNAWEPVLMYGKRRIYQDLFHVVPGTALGRLMDDTGDHPCPKPVALFRWLAEQLTDDTDTILDPFDLGRKAIGIEIEERYCEIAAKRLAQEVLPL